MSYFSKFMLIFTLLIFSMACSDLVSENSLYGYDRGKKTFKLETKLNLQKYPGETTGYRYKEINYWGVGNKNSRKTTRKSLLNHDFSLRKTQKTEIINSKPITTEVARQNNQVTIIKREGSKVLLERTIETNDPVFVAILPEMYAKDLKNKGDSKQYAVLNDRKVKITLLTVRFLGTQTMTVKGVTQETLHFQLQAISAPKEYDNYYIDPKSFEILQIKFGDIRFTTE